MVSFNPRTYIRYDIHSAVKSWMRMFQSTYLYKVRLNGHSWFKYEYCFNPRTYIRYDFSQCHQEREANQFQSTYLYKVRLLNISLKMNMVMFQSTYLYKVRLSEYTGKSEPYSFNPRTYIRYDAKGITIQYTQRVSIHVPI